jgi:hypothetical protein
MLIFQRAQDELRQAYVNEHYKGVEPKWKIKPTKWERYYWIPSKVPQYAIDFLCTFEGVAERLKSNRNRSIYIMKVDPNRKKKSKKVKINFESVEEIIEHKELAEADKEFIKTFD